MNLLATLLAAVLTTGTPWVVRFVAPEAQRAWWWVAIPSAAATAFVLSWSGIELHGRSWAMTIAFAIVASILAMQMVIDLAVHRLPRLLSHVGLVVVLVAAAVHPAGTTSGFAGALAGAVLLTVITIVLMGISRGSLGMGDLHLSPLLGALVGWFDPLAVFWMWFAAAMLGAAYVGAGVLSGRLDRKSFIPYGPPMIIGSLVAILVWSLTHGVA